MIMGGHSSVYAGYCVGCPCWVHDSTSTVGKPMAKATATGSVNSIPSSTSSEEAPIRLGEMTILPATIADANLTDEKEVISNRIHPTLPLTITSEDDAHHEQIMILLSSDQPNSYENQATLPLFLGAVILAAAYASALLSKRKKLLMRKKLKVSFYPNLSTDAVSSSSPSSLSLDTLMGKKLEVSFPNMSTDTVSNSTLSLATSASDEQVSKLKEENKNLREQIEMLKAKELSVPSSSSEKVPAYSQVVEPIITEPTPPLDDSDVNVVLRQTKKRLRAIVKSAKASIEKLNVEVHDLKEELKQTHESFEKADKARKELQDDIDKFANTFAMQHEELQQAQGTVKKLLKENEKLKK